MRAQCRISKSELGAVTAGRSMLLRLALMRKSLGGYEWINKIPTVPIYYLAKPQPRERTWEDQRGKKTLLSLTLVSFCRGAFLA